MGCGDSCPIFPGKRYDDWELTDPAGLDLEYVRPIRDDISHRVVALLEEINLAEINLEINLGSRFPG
jgi:hypothetical protein